MKPETDFQRFLDRLNREIAQKQIRTLRDMTEEEIRRLEQHYGVPVRRPSPRREARADEAEVAADEVAS